MADDILVQLKKGQQAWAREHGIIFDEAGYCESIESNLFEPLSACSHRDIGAGDGSELGKGDTRGKIQALHSSSALVCNFFDYWRGRDLGILRQSLGFSERFCGLALEQKFPTGLGGIAPNLDVVLYGCDGSLVAIESKFTEPFIKSKTKNVLKKRYFLDDGGLWASAGLSGCQALAEDLRDKRVQFQTLDATQLLKHMLGLASSGHPWTLTYLWYSPGGPMSDQHSEELAAFSQGIGVDSGKVRVITYQDLFNRLVGLLSTECAEYVAYLRTRYFDFGASLFNSAQHQTPLERT